jgi:hypothetical protein
MYGGMDGEYSFLKEDALEKDQEPVPKQQQKIHDLQGNIILYIL